MILYDISKSISFGLKELLQAYVAVSLAYTAITANNGCGLIMFADEIIKYVPARMGKPHFMKIITAIAEAEPVDCQNTNLNKAIAKLMKELPESLTFILSDFLYPFEPQYYFHRTIHGTNKHEVKGIQVLEEYEAGLPAGSKGLISLFDYETGEDILLDLNQWQSYNVSMKQKLADIKYRLSHAGIDLLTITPADSFFLKINSFMRNMH